MKKLNITFCSFPDFSGNAKALYEYMVKTYKDNMNYTWVVYDKKTVAKLKSKGINAVLMDTDEFKKYIPKTNVFFTTQGNLDGDKKKCKNAVYVELWHGIGPKPVGFAQKNPSKDDIKGYGNIGRIVDYFIVPSEFWKTIFGAIFKVEYNRVKSLGMPILDYFKYSDGKNNLSKLLDKDLSMYKKIIMFMPTFKQGFNHNDVCNISSNIFNFIDKYDEKDLDDYLIKNNYLLCIKKHPGDKSKINFNNMKNIITINEDMLFKNDLSINEIINAFDLMITDYSSIGTEFVFFERPLLFVTGDYDEYKANRGIYFDNLDFWTPGPKCNDINSLKKEIKKLLTDDSYYKNERINSKKLWYGDTNDGGCDRICNLLFDNDGQLLNTVERHNSELNYLKDQNVKLNNSIIKNKYKIKEQKERIKYLEEKEQELARIKYSRSYKMIQKINNIRKKVTRK